MWSALDLPAIHMWSLTATMVAARRRAWQATESLCKRGKGELMGNLVAPPVRYSRRRSKMGGKARLWAELAIILFTFFKVESAMSPVSPDARAVKT